MPFGDGTGPTGAGAMTGRGLGVCGNGQGGFGSRNFARRGRAMRFGGARLNNNDNHSVQEQIQDLTSKMEILSKQIEKLQDPK